MAAACNETMGSFLRHARSWLAALVAPVLLGACAGGPSSRAPGLPPEWEGDATVQTRYGAVRGLEDRDGTWVWKAIPFARPPVGELRWRAPQEPEPWKGVRTRYFFARPCLQFRPLTGGLTGREDCLYLNIWRPRSRQVGLPVYVWIHGGGNSIGSATYVPDYYGNPLASRGNLVFVSVNYRLGPFGWFSHPALREGLSVQDDSGNYGTLDLIQALRWIRENIRAFGGDPGRVLVAGESAGAMNVLSLLTSPLAAGLFQRAVIESGVTLTSSPAAGEARARQALLQLLRRAGRARSRPQAEGVLAGMKASDIRVFLRARPAREILRCYRPGRSGMIDNPSLFTDGAVLPADGYEVLSRGDYPGKVPVMIGSNLEETKMFLFLSGSPSWKSELFRAAARFGSERWKADGVDGVARRLASHPDQPPVYAYLFAWGAPNEQGRSPLPGSWGQRLGAFHSLEIPFFLGTDTVEGTLLGSLLFTESNRRGRKALSSAMMRYLVSFLRIGDPEEGAAAEGTPAAESVSPLPAWLAWSNRLGGPKCIRFDVRGDTPEIAMSDRELTREEVEAEMQRELSPELLAATRRLLDRPLVGPEQRP
jgi:para-nitrobenzyl esterase